MKSRIAISFAAFLGLLMLCSPVFAHHGSNVSYDTSKTETITGTVTSFLWTNPHCQIYFDVKDDAGNVVHWAGEVPDPPFLAKKAGWSKDVIKAGDQVSITGSPSRAGAPAILVRKVLLPDGKTISGGGGGQGVPAAGGAAQ